ncbi:hypothetical protein CSKR_105703 [Clonorchis sinensis]|uniref:Uncharacterized protein n=1 Tax=Clonorchis sinensis TaxID=79923 RepID=A0A3R7DP88_CLOSI|nr:hypothetical protein CSKR_105703 [Clonorchis sinensis]
MNGRPPALAQFLWRFRNTRDDFDEYTHLHINLALVRDSPGISRSSRSAEGAVPGRLMFCLLRYSRYCDTLYRHCMMSPKKGETGLGPSKKFSETLGTRSVFIHHTEQFFLYVTLLINQ